MAPYKVFVKRDDYEIKFGIPKSWRAGPVSKILTTFLDAYNAKFADAPLDASKVHLKTADGIVLASEEVLQTYVVHKTHLVVVDGPAPEKTINPAAEAAAAAAKKAAEPTEAEQMKAKGWLKCKNYGCQQWYDPVANEEGEPTCKHHVSPPLFHDTKKGWTCCRDRLVYDWADFKSIEGCTLGRHSQEKPGANFQESPTLAAAAAAKEKVRVRCCCADRGAPGVCMWAGPLMQVALVGGGVTLVLTTCLCCCWVRGFQLFAGAAATEEH